MDDVTVVIPVKDRTEEITLLLENLVGVRVIVVDDGSDDWRSLRESCAKDDVLLFRHETTRGPGAARVTGAAACTTPLVCFVDSDVEFRTSDLERLLPAFGDPLLGAVAPRIVGAVGSNLKDRFEHAASPLDMGVHPALIRPGSTVSYVPAAVLLVRQELALDLFDPALTVGEDVDAVWRLVDAGWLVRYEPTVRALHPARATWSSWWRQRHSYGRSAATLEARHGDAVAPLRGSAWALSGWLCMAAGWPVLGASLIASGLPRLREQLMGVVPEPDRTALQLTVRQVTASAPVVARQILRSYAPLLFFGAVFSKRLRRGVLATVLIAGLGRWRASNRSLDPIRFTVMSLFDDLAYSTGLWRGVAETRRTGALRPRFVRSGQRAHSEPPPTQRSA